MSVRELVVLGTASQVPTRRRNHNGYFLRWDGDGILFDPGEGTQRQMIHYGVAASDISDICITHFHGDHCLGFASLVQRISLDEVQHAVRVHYPGSGQIWFDRLRRASIFRDVAKITPNPITRSGTIHTTDRWTLDARALDHSVDCYGFRLVEPNQWNVDGDAARARGLVGRSVGELKREGVATAPDGRAVRLDDVATLRRGQKVAFVMDTRLCDGAFELAADVDLLICESTYLEADGADAHKNAHLTARQAARIAKESGARRLVLTHISQRYRETEPFLQEALEVFDDVHVAEDGDVVALPPRRQEAPT